MRRRTLLEKNGIITVNPFNAVAGDILFYDATENKNIIVPFDSFAADLLPTPKYIPIGVVVVPGSHQVYGPSTNGICAVMSLGVMSYLASGGTTNLNDAWLYWGNSGCTPNTSEGLLIKNKVNQIGPPNSLYFDCRSNVLADYVYLPTDYNLDFLNSTNQINETILNPYDENTAYRQYGFTPGSGSATEIEYCVSSPYKTDGSRNSTYYTTNCGTVNALADFNGKSNTQTLILNSTYQPNWKTDATLSNNNVANHYPAACSCWRYYTFGTNKGDWYLPALGELGYYAARYKKINNTIDELKSAYNLKFIGHIPYGTGVSTRVGESSNHVILVVDCYEGRIWMNDADRNSGEYYFRAFMQVGN